MLACFFLTEQGCILDLKKGVYLSKTNVTNRGSAPLEELSSSLGVSGDLQDTWTSAHAKIMGIAAYEDAHTPVFFLRVFLWNCIFQCCNNENNFVKAPLIFKALLVLIDM